MTEIDWVFAIWAGVATGFAYYQHKFINRLLTALVGAKQMMLDVADSKIELYRQGEEIKWRSCKLDKDVNL